MTSAVENPVREHQECDLWAIQVVVREGKYMALTREEKVVATQLMRRKGMITQDIADRLRVGIDVAQKFTTLKPCIALDEIPAKVIGNTVAQVRVSRSDVRGRR